MAYAAKTKEVFINRFIEGRGDAEGLSEVSVGFGFVRTVEFLTFKFQISISPLILSNTLPESLHSVFCVQKLSWKRQ
jgi:hypothetical protein